MVSTQSQLGRARGWASEVKSATRMKQCNEKKEMIFHIFRTPISKSNKEARTALARKQPKERERERERKSEKLEKCNKNEMITLLL